MRKTQKKHRKLLQLGENCIIIEINPNNVKGMNIELLSATPPDQSDLFVFNNGQAINLDCNKVLYNSKIKDKLKEEKRKENKMSNVINLAKYMIQLFYKTDKKYHCSRTKIEKLLSIAYVISAKNGYVLFGDKISVNHCGTGIPVLAGFILSDIIIADNTNKRIEQNEIKDDIPYPKIYKENEDLSDEDKKIITDVFLRFGAYDTKKLGNEIDVFKNEISEIDSEDSDLRILNFEKTATFFSNEQNNVSNSDDSVVKYIFTY